MRENSQQYIKMCKNAHKCAQLRRTRGPHIHKRRRADSRPNSHGWTYMNAHECVRMRKNAPDCGITHTYTREAERTQGKTRTDMGWTGCGRARRRANVAPMCHYMPSKSSSDSSPSPSSSTVSSVGWMRVPATMWRRVPFARKVRLTTFSRSCSR